MRKTRMTKKEILRRIKLYFAIYELVDKPTLDLFGEETCWQFLDITQLHCLLIVREGIGKPMTVNNWYWGGGFSQRGLRTNKSPIVTKKIRIYLSAHCLGKGDDFDVEDIEAEEVRDWIIENKRLFPCKIRLEHLHEDTDKDSPTFGQMIPINWVHMDTYHKESNPKVYLFNV